MNDAHTDNMTAGTIAEEMRRYGFQPGEPIYEGADTISLEDIRSSLFESTYSKVVPIHIESTNSEVRIPVVITKIEAFYAPYGPSLDSKRIACHEKPDWVAEGWVVRSGFDQLLGFDRVRILIYEPAEVYWQVIPQNPEPDQPLVVKSM